MNESFADDLAAVADIKTVSKILEVACRSTGMGFAAVARVTEERWVALAVRDEIGFGLAPGGELVVKTTICDAIRQSGELVVIDHVEHDEYFRDHHTPRTYGFQSYISVPVVLRDGSFFGTLCAIDPRPARLKNSQAVGTFELFAELIAMHLDARGRLLDAETTLRDERKTSELREQFIAVLGHDLRNPLASIDGAARFLLKSSLDERGVGLVRHVQASVLRMSGLISNLLDFARGQLGGGIPVSLKAEQDLVVTLDQVIEEVRFASPDAKVEVAIDLGVQVICDKARIAQLVSNLLANAVSHGRSDLPITVLARTSGNQLEIAVENSGDPVPASLLPRLFQPFVRARADAGQQGLGLGLHIAAEIAKAHHGSIDVASDANRTRFTFRMPLSGRDMTRARET